MKSSASRLYLLKEGYYFSVTKDSDESTGSADYDESSLVEIWISVGSEVEIQAGIISIRLIAISVDPDKNRFVSTQLGILVLRVLGLTAI